MSVKHNRPYWGILFPNGARFYLSPDRDMAERMRARCEGAFPGLRMEVFADLHAWHDYARTAPNHP